MPAERTRHLPGLGVNDGRECQDDDGGEGGEGEFHCIGNDSSSREMTLRLGFVLCAELKFLELLLASTCSKC